MRFFLGRGDLDELAAHVGQAASMAHPGLGVEEIVASEAVGLDDALKISILNSTVNNFVSN